MKNSDEIHFQLLRIIDTNPEISQRELAKQTGVSLGKVNYCLKALIEKGLIKARNFRNSSHKWSYLYALTPSGIEHRAKLTVHFLRRKTNEFDRLRDEIYSLEQDISTESNEFIKPVSVVTPKN